MASERRRAQDRRRLHDSSRLELFRDLDAAALDTLLRAYPVQEFLADAVVLRPGDTNRTVYVLLTGRLRVHLDAIDAGNPIVVEPGGCIGELSIIDGKPASAFVIAEAGSHVLAIDDTRFWAEFAPHPGITRNLMRILSERMRQNNEAVLQGLRQRLTYEHMQKELLFARDIQRSMLAATLPAPEPGFSYSTSASMEPAREVGGDLYDLFRTDDGALLFCVGDVSGKGMPAALFMARTVEIVRVVSRMLPAEGPAGDRLQAILAHTNEQLCLHNDATMFVTLLVGLIDPASGVATLCSAGHEAPFQVTAGAPPARATLTPGVPLGVAIRGRWPPASVALAPGDLLFAFTDGLTEAFDANAAAFGEDRIVEVLAATRGLGPEAIDAAMRAAVREFVGAAPRSDDLTLVAIRRI